jgi:hypothetical protein
MRDRFDRYGDPEEHRGRNWEPDHGYEPAWDRARDAYDRDRGSAAYGGDMLAAASFAGRGPRGYRRPDDRITEDVCRTLTDNPDVDASDIIVRVEGGVVTLTGTVHDRYERRVAEDAICEVWGVQDVRNHLRVGLAGVTSGRNRADMSVADTGGTPVRQP